MTPQRTRTADTVSQLPDDDEDIQVGEDVKPPKKRATSTTSRTSLGLPPRKAGRPSGPVRVPMNVRVLLQTDQLVTEIIEHTDLTGPQDVADAAIAHYAAHLRRTGKLPKPEKITEDADE
ncbi:hypothetical protein OG264_39530 (plasmid) [Streptomyces xanthophaeus]|uniref:hypothetical protein n=1 Tax=Streptomyces xanthophaeus TaxID=67385 RepID=UPI002F916DE1|nr:hypothetical protein OG264_39685 [Streptomyces xanthophaeus]WST27627.1 hypothetical protein OG264_39530 [Streptomyces xanthophaeus]WST65977.1 hypothetical protein OG605_40925 [Streptomyces xanthophaeus]WST66005.1 hypothetical protein OG605_40770 [Streptomyces xanthophaeus]